MGCDSRWRHVCLGRGRVLGDVVFRRLACFRHSSRIDPFGIDLFALFVYTCFNMRKYTHLFGLSTLFALLFTVASVHANGVLGQHDWNTGAHGWTNAFNFADTTRSAVGGNPFGRLDISFDATASPEVLEAEWFDVIQVDADALFAGNWSTNQQIKFDFFASDQTPHDMQVQFGSTNGNVWSYNVTAQVTQTQTWTEVRANLSFSDAWGPLPGFDDTADQFLADLGAIDWVGLYIFREEASAENYGLDNFVLHVGTPEPGEYALLIAALCVVFFSFRRETPDCDGEQKA